LASLCMSETLIWFMFFLRTPKYLGAQSLEVMAMMAFWRTSHFKRSSKLSLERPYLQVFKNSKSDIEINFGTVPRGHGNDGFLMDLPLQKVQKIRCRVAIFASSQKIQCYFWPLCVCLRRWFDLRFFFRTPKYLGAPSLEVMEMMAFWRTSKGC
jgi:hypothetical protein